MIRQVISYIQLSMKKGLSGTFWLLEFVTNALTVGAVVNEYQSSLCTVVSLSC